MRRGFTLIEVLVTMAIISILAGIMVPSVWKWWESQEIQTTKERLNALKLAMVGDRSLVQNGIRTSYGFVGDYGELPVQGQLSTATLRTYIPGGYTAESYKDAWGRDFSYTAYDNLAGYDGRFLSAKLCSDGPDGIPGNTDDICVDIPVSEVAPTYRIQGNFVFSNLTGHNYGANFQIEYRDPLNSSNYVSKSSGCKNAFPNFTTIFPNAINPVRVPVGKITVSSHLYNTSNCSGTAIKSSGKLDYFITDNLQSILINLPMIVYTP